MALHSHNKKKLLMSVFPKIDFKVVLVSYGKKGFNIHTPCLTMLSIME